MDKMCVQRIAMAINASNSEESKGNDQIAASFFFRLCVYYFPASLLLMGTSVWYCINMILMGIIHSLIGDAIDITQIFRCAHFSLLRSTYVQVLHIHPMAMPFNNYNTETLAVTYPFLYRGMRDGRSSSYRSSTLRILILYRCSVEGHTRSISLIWEWPPIMGLVHPKRRN